MINDLTKGLLPLVNKDRIKDALFDLVRIPNSTGGVRLFANHLATVLRNAVLSEEDSLLSQTSAAAGWR